MTELKVNINEEFKVGFELFENKKFNESLDFFKNKVLNGCVESNRYIGRIYEIMNNNNCIKYYKLAIKNNILDANIDLIKYYLLINKKFNIFKYIKDINKENIQLIIIYYENMLDYFNAEKYYLIAINNYSLQLNCKVGVMFYNKFVKEYSFSKNNDDYIKCIQYLNNGIDYDYNCLGLLTKIYYYYDKSSYENLLIRYKDNEKYLNVIKGFYYLYDNNNLCIKLLKTIKNEHIGINYIIGGYYYNKGYELFENDDYINSLKYLIKSSKYKFNDSNLILSKIYSLQNKYLESKKYFIKYIKKTPNNIKEIPNGIFLNIDDIINIINNISYNRISMDTIDLLIKRCFDNTQKIKVYYYLLNLFNYEEIINRINHIIYEACDIEIYEKYIDLLNTINKNNYNIIISLNKLNKVCKICEDYKTCILPCHIKHRCCITCLLRIKKCPYCREIIIN